MNTAVIPAPMQKVHDGLSYTVVLRPDDSCVYLDIAELGLINHQVHTSCAANSWKDLEREADQAAFTIIDLHNSAPKIFL